MFGTSASDMEIGTVDPARLDSSSTTLRGQIPITVLDESSTSLGNVYTINCANGADCSVTGAVGQISVVKVSPAVALGTFTFLLQAEGPVYVETNTFVAFPGAFDVVGQSTINVTSVQSFNLGSSSVGWASYNIAVTTQTLSPITTWQYIIANSTVGTNERYSVWITTAFALYPNYSYALHVTSVPVTPGQKAQEFGIKMRGWLVTAGSN